MLLELAGAVVGGFSALNKKNAAEEAIKKQNKQIEKAQKLLDYRKSQTERFMKMNLSDNMIGYELSTDPQSKAFYSQNASSITGSGLANLTELDKQIGDLETKKMSSDLGSDFLSFLGGGTEGFGQMMDFTSALDDMKMSKKDYEIDTGEKFVGASDKVDNSFMSILGGTWDILSGKNADPNNIWMNNNYRDQYYTGATGRIRKTF